MTIDITHIEFRCLRCGRCCGPHYVSPAEQEIIDRYLHDTGIEKRQYRSIYDKCPYFEDSSCLIYPVRPMICRLMGLTPVLLCPEGVMPSVFIPSDVALKMIRICQGR